MNPAIRPVSRMPGSAGGEGAPKRRRFRRKSSASSSKGFGSLVGAPGRGVHCDRPGRAHSRSSCCRSTLACTPVWRVPDPVSWSRLETCAGPRCNFRCQEGRTRGIRAAGVPGLQAQAVAGRICRVTSDHPGEAQSSRGSGSCGTIRKWNLVAGRGSRTPAWMTAGAGGTGSERRRLPQCPPVRSRGFGCGLAPESGRRQSWAGSPFGIGPSRVGAAR